MPKAKRRELEVRTREWTVPAAMAITRSPAI